MSKQVYKMITSAELALAMGILLLSASLVSADGFVGWPQYKDKDGDPQDDKICQASPNSCTYALNA